MRFRASAPVFTLNFATANPDFNRCVPGNADVAHFGFEPIDKTYRTYDGDEGVLDFVRLGCGETALHPQLHGREHLNATAWLTDAATDPVVEYACSLRMVGLDDAFYNGIDALNNGNTLIDVHGYLEDAVAIFKRLFGFAPRSFIPPCYVANKECELIAAELGIETIQSSPKRNVPKGNDSYSRRINVFGRSNVPGQCRLIRNVQFEPSRSMFQGRASTSASTLLSPKSRRLSGVGSQRWYAPIASTTLHAWMRGIVRSRSRPSTGFCRSWRRGTRTASS